MSCGRIAALGGAILMLFPGLCFFFVGAYSLQNGFRNRSDAETGLMMIGVSLVIVGLAVWLAITAFRKPEVPVGDQTKEPPKTE